MKSWKKSWFFIEGGQLKYAEKAGKKERGAYDISKISSVQPASDAKKFGFKFVIGDKTVILAADSQEDYDGWLKALQPKGGGGGAAAGSPSKPARRPSMDDYTVIKVIGKGTFGTVQLVRSKIDQKFYAMKLMDKRLLQEADQVSQTIVERDVLFQVRHPFTVGAHATFQTPEMIVMILDYVPGGELFGRLKEEGKFSESRVRLYAAELALAIAHLHSAGYIYRDLKPENILVDRGGHLRMTDFGLVKSKMKDASSTTSTFCGTPEYIAPEMLQQQPYTRAVDWWSYGILIYEMLAGIPPFYDENTNRMYRKILQDPIPFTPEFSPNAKNLVERLLDRNPATRLGAGEKDVEEIKAHPFFQGLSWEKVLAKEIKPEWVPTLANEGDTKFFENSESDDGAPDYSGTVIAQSTQDEFKGFTFTDDGPLG